jgi:hypothetical protein
MNTKPRGKLEAHTPEMWVMLNQLGDSRGNKTVQQAARTLARKKDMKLRFVEVPNDPEVIKTQEDWQRLLPPELRGNAKPEILWAHCPGMKFDKGLFSNTFLVLDNYYPSVITQPDALVMKQTDYVLGKVTIEPFVPRENIHTYPLDTFFFDSERYRNACKEVKSDSGSLPGQKTITLLVGDVSGIKSRTILLEKIEDLIKKSIAENPNTTLLISTSRRTKVPDVNLLREQFAKERLVKDQIGEYNLEFYESPGPSAPADPNNPYYRFLARADVIITLDSASMALEAAHTGKPVYADADTVIDFHLTPYVHPFGKNTTLDKEPLPKLDIAGGIAEALSGMYRKYQLAQKEPATRTKSVKREGRVEASGRQKE